MGFAPTTKGNNMSEINNFSGEYEFLNNGYLCPVVYEDEVYPSLEHAYQAAKTDDLDLRENIKSCLTVTDARSNGKNVILASDWQTKKLEIMETLIRNKFNDNFDLKLKLVLTQNADLVQGNCRDTFWGQNKYNVGENHVGRLLEKIREEIIDQEGDFVDVLYKFLNSKKLGFVMDLIADGTIKAIIDEDNTEEEEEEEEALDE